MNTARVGILLGPTASGKTDISLRLALKLDAEIVSADSMSVYRHMDIGTAKPTILQQKLVKHHVIDVVEPNEPYDAAQYRRDAVSAIDDIVSRGKRALVVGGSGLYIRALSRGLFPGPEADPELRLRLEEMASPEIYERLCGLDPVVASRIHPNDRVRIIRALEVFYLTGKPITLLQREHGFASSLFPVLLIGLKVDRPVLKNRISRRVENMFLTGLIEEVKDLKARGYGPQLRPMQAFAYRHAYDILQEKISHEEAVRRIIRDTWHLARRQITWFKKEPDIIWLHYDEEAEMENLLAEFWNTTSKSGVS